MLPIELVTHRLRMRQWRDSDFAPFARLNADPEVMEYFPDVLDRAASDKLAIRIQSLIAERGWGFWAVDTLETSEFIGFVGLHIPIAELPCSPCVEIGWRLASRYWGKGYASEAARASLRFGFETLNLDEIVSFTTLKNARSRAVMVRLGMQEDAEIFDHPQIPKDSPVLKHCLYRLSKHRWNTIKNTEQRQE